VAPFLELAGAVQSPGEIGDFWSQQLHLAAQLGVVWKLVPEFGKLFPSGEILSGLAELGGFPQSGFDSGEVGDDLLECLLTSRVALDRRSDFVLAAENLAVIS